MRGEILLSIGVVIGVSIAILFQTWDKTIAANGYEDLLEGAEGQQYACAKDCIDRCADAFCAKDCIQQNCGIHSRNRELSPLTLQTIRGS